LCGRYRRTTQEEELARLYHIPIPSQTDLPISYNIAPSQKVLTIRCSWNITDYQSVPNSLQVANTSCRSSDKDFYYQGPRRWLRFHEIGGKEHEMPAHHEIEETIDEYLSKETQGNLNN
jgi:hypothetical protein